MKMSHEYVLDGEARAVTHHLPLRSLATIKEERVSFPLRAIALTLRRTVGHAAAVPRNVTRIILYLCSTSSLDASARHLCSTSWPSWCCSP